MGLTVEDPLAGTARYQPIPDFTDDHAPDDPFAAAMNGQHPTGATPFRVYTWDEISEWQDPAWLVDPIVPAGAFAVLYGPSGCYKTFVVLDLAASVASDTPWMGRHSVAGGAVLYVIGEGRGGWHKRRHAWQSAHPHATVKLWTLPEAIAVPDDDTADRIDATIRAIGEPVRLLVLDTYARTLGNRNESSTEDAGAYIRVVDRIRETHGCAVIVLHHTGWDTTRERGSTALRAAADTVIKCERIGAGELRITNTPPGGKQRDAEEFPTMQLRTVPRGESLTVEHVATFTNEQTQRERDLALVVDNVRTSPGINLRTLRSVLPGGKDKATAMIDEALRDGLILNRGTANGHRYYVTDSRQQEVPL